MKQHLACRSEAIKNADSPRPVILSEVAVGEADGNAVEGSLPPMCTLVSIQGATSSIVPQ